MSSKSEQKAPVDKCTHAHIYTPFECKLCNRHPIFAHFELGTCTQHVDEPSEATGLKGPKNGIVWTPDGGDYLSDTK